MSELKTIVSLDDLTPDNLNANKGTQRGTGMLEDSLQQFGAGRSVLADRAGRLIAGNKTVESAAGIGMTDVVVVRTTGDQLVVVQRTDLDLNDPKARGLAVRDNRIAEVNLDWDAAALAALAEQGVELDDLWSADELTALIEKEIEAPEDFKSFDENIETEHECPKCGYRFSGGKGGNEA
jgi:hypothetical protein